jgi:predicted AlkP superfamily pyrophosphatase or phosphodiesterase
MNAINQRLLTCLTTSTLLGACAKSTPVPAMPIGPTAPRVVAAAPRLVVFIVVDQMPSWNFSKRSHLYQHGFARLLKDGVYIPKLELPYAMTFTAAGHTTLATGVTPTVHGVMANQWYRRDLNAEKPAEWDGTNSILTVTGTADSASTKPLETASSSALKVDGIADALKQQHPTAKAVAIGLKARAACYVAGRKPDIAVFFDPSAGGMTTSTFYGATVPAWLLSFNQTHSFHRYDQAVWLASDSALLAKETGKPDDSPGEGAEHNNGIVFPHNMATTDNAGEALVATPFGDELVIDTADAAIEAYNLGADETADLLAISLNSHDYAGHNWGQESWEVLDLALKQDVLLGRFFDRLDARVGAHNYAVVLTSDHGATPLVNTNPVPTAQRISPKVLVAAMEKAAIDSIGRKPAVVSAPWIARLTSLNVYLSSEWRGLPPGVSQRAMMAVVEAARRVPGIADAQLAEAAIRTGPSCKAPESLMAGLFCQSLVPGLAGEIYVQPAEGALISDYQTGTHHDSPTDANRFVPLLMWGDAVVADPATTDAAALPMNTQVAATLAKLLGIAPPTTADQRSFVK